MPATPARIARITRAVLPVQAGPDAAVVAAYGNAARDNLQPVEAFFENESDAAAMADERMDLVGVSRRRFAIGITDAAPVLALALDSMVPTVTVIDSERAISSDFLATEWTVDLETEEATIKAWG